MGGGCIAACTVTGRARLHTETQQDVILWAAIHLSRLKSWPSLGNPYGRVLHNTLHIIQLYSLSCRWCLQISDYLACQTLACFSCKRSERAEMFQLLQDTARMFLGSGKDTLACALHTAGSCAAKLVGARPCIYCTATPQSQLLLFITPCNLQ